MSLKEALIQIQQEKKEKDITAKIQTMIDEQKRLLNEGLDVNKDGNIVKVKKEWNEGVLTEGGISYYKMNDKWYSSTTQGLYILSDVGIYTNLGGLVTTTGKLNYAYFDGTTWKLISVDIPNFVAPIDNLTSTSTTIPLSANQGKVLDENKLNKGTYTGTVS